MSELWPIERLVELAAKALETVPYDGQTSKRIRDVPDLRTARYYTTIGLLDRPQEMRGRTAYYGRRHLLQLVAVKRLQAQGLSLVAIQQQLAAADTAWLARCADLPAGFLEKAAAGMRDRARTFSPEQSRKAGQGQSDQRRKRSQFWAAIPTPSRGEHVPATGSTVVATPAVVLHLAPGIFLTVEGECAHSLDEAKLAKLRSVLAALVEHLEESDVPSGRSDDRAHPKIDTNGGETNDPESERA